MFSPPRLKFILLQNANLKIKYQNEVLTNSLLRFNTGPCLVFVVGIVDLKKKCFFHMVLNFICLLKAKRTHKQQLFLNLHFWFSLLLSGICLEMPVSTKKAIEKRTQKSHYVQICRVIYKM